MLRTKRPRSRQSHLLPARTCIAILWRMGSAAPAAPFIPALATPIFAASHTGDAMKDARGHGSDGRGNKGIPLAPGFHAPSQANAMRPDRDYKNDAERTVADLRSRMTNTGPGHQAGLFQGIKNFIGGRS